MPYMPDDPAVMTPSQRRREIAALLARGVRRLRQCRENPPGSDHWERRNENRRPTEADRLLSV